MLGGHLILAGSLIRQRETPQTYDELSFEERLMLLVDDELLNRENSRVARLRKSANLKYQAAPERLHYPVSRGLRSEQMRELLNGHYIIHKKSLLITGPAARYYQVNSVVTPGPTNSQVTFVIDYN